MTERDRPVYCTRCGSIVHPGDSFCGVCGARVTPAAPDAGPPGDIPTQVYAPPGVSRGGTNRTLALFVGLGISVLILLAIGTVVALTLLRSAPETSGAADPPRPEPREEARGLAEETEEASTPDASGSEERLGVGDSVEAEGVRATLNGVRVLPTTEFDVPIESPDNLFVAADLTFENVSDRPIAVSSLLEFVLKNEEGYSASQSIHSQQRQLAEGDISPSQKTSGEIVYEVPPGSKGLQLDYQPFLRGDAHTWYIGDADSLPGATEPPSAAEAPEEDPATSESAVVEAAEDYYQAVDQENWAYTYENLDSQTRALFSEEEWYLKNQYFADTEGLELSTMDVVVNGSVTDVPVSVSVYRTFKNGTSISRDTYFVREEGTWKHRFTQEEIEIFMPGVPYEEFVALQ
jgi:hypothetical protein